MVVPDPHPDSIERVLSMLQEQWYQGEVFWFSESMEGSRSSFHNSPDDSNLIKLLSIPKL